MKVPRIQPVEMTRKIRDLHASRLAGKTTEGVIAFYRAAGQAVVKDARRAKPRRRTPR